MRVLHVLNSLAGGATQSLAELMATTQRLDAEVEHFVVFPGAEGERPGPELDALAADAQGLPLESWNRQDGIGAVGRLLTWSRTVQRTGGHRRSRRQLASLMRQWRIDVVHTNSAVIRDAAVVARGLGLPHLWHVRERLGAGGFKRFWKSDPASARYIVTHSVAVPVISRYVQEFFVRHGQAAATRLVFDGISVDRLTGPAVTARAFELRRSWGVPETAVLVATVGSPAVAVKRVDLFVEAAREVARRRPGVRFVVLGSLPRSRGWLRDLGRSRILRSFAELERATGDLGEAFVWAGRVTDMAAVMAALDVLVHSCEVEGLSRSILEAMAAARPVVGVEAGSNPEAVVHGETGLLVPPGSAQALAEAVDRLVAEPDLRAQFGDAGRRRVARDFSAEAHHQTMCALFEQAAARRPAGWPEG